MPPSLAGDTIVVKGDYGWNPPLSPDTHGSMSPKNPTLGQNSLAQSNTPQNLESPEPLNKDTPLNNTPRTRSNPTKRTSSNSKKLKKDVTTMEERLQAMPEKRPLPWRPGVEPGAEIETGGDSRRKQIRFGCLLATRGDVAPIPCNSCANGRGKFNVCVALEGYFKGACASCQLSGRPNRCSIKQNDDVALSPNIDTTDREDVPMKEPEKTSPITLQTSGPPSAKRRRTNPVPEWEKTRPQWNQELEESHARLPMNEIVQRPWATVNAPLSTSHTPVSITHAPVSKNSPQSSRNGFDDGLQRNSIGWAAVNQPTPTPNPRLSMTNNGQVEVFSNSARRTMDHERRENVRHDETTPKEESSSALIDILPRTKQRQVYGLVSGLQGGIQQLQRELDLLKKALGIDDED